MSNEERFRELELLIEGDPKSAARAKQLLQELRETVLDEKREPDWDGGSPAETSKTMPFRKDWS